MSVVAWDGKTMAADRQATFQGCRREVTKLWKVAPTDDPENKVLVGSVGDHEVSLLLLHWVRNGRPLNGWPECQKHDNFTEMLVLSRDGSAQIQLQLHLYQAHPIGQRLDPRQPFAIGSAAEIALGAMHAGATAIQAVGIARELSIYCGFGTDAHAAASL